MQAIKKDLKLNKKFKLDVMKPVRMPKAMVLIITPIVCMHDKMLFIPAALLLAFLYFLDLIFLFGAVIFFIIYFTIDLA